MSHNFKRSAISAAVLATFFVAPIYAQEEQEIDIEQSAEVFLEEYSDAFQENFFEGLKQRTNQRREGGLSQNSINKHVGTLRRYCKFFKQHYFFQLSAKIPEHQRGETEIKPLTIAQIGSLFDTCEDDLLGIRDKAMLALYYSSGLRKAEGLRLNVEDINLNSRQIHIRKSKTGKQRVVFMSKKSAQIIH